MVQAPVHHLRNVPRDLVEVARGITQRFTARLTWRLALPPAILAITVSLITVVAPLASGTFPLTRAGTPMTPDFLSEIVGGRLVLEGQRDHLYEPAAQLEAARATLPEARLDGWPAYIMPPVFALAMVPFAALPYGWSVALWLVLMAIALAAALGLLWPFLGDRPWRSAVLVVGSYPMVFLISSGQNSAIWLLLLATGLRLLVAGRPGMAGIVLGLGALKPQIFLVMPLYFLCARRWRALFAWCATAGILAVGSWLMVGTGGIRAYLTIIQIVSGAGDDLAWHMLSVPAWLRWTLPTPLPTHGTAAVALVSIWAVARTARTAPVVAGFAVAVTAAAVSNPHFLAYDGLILTIPLCVILSKTHVSQSGRLTVAAVMVFAWSAILRHEAVNESTGSVRLLAAPWAALAVLALLILAVRAASAQSHSLLAPAPHERRSPMSSGGTGLRSDGRPSPTPPRFTTSTQGDTPSVW